MLRAFASARLRLRELGTPRQGWITRDVHRFGTRAGRAPVWYESLSAQRVMSSGTGARLRELGTLDMAGPRARAGRKCGKRA